MRAIFGDPGFFEKFFAPRVLPCCFSCFWVILTQKSDLKFFVRGVRAPKPTLVISRGFIKMVKEGTPTWAKIFDEKNFSYVSPLKTRLKKLPEPLLTLLCHFYLMRSPTLLDFYSTTSYLSPATELELSGTASYSHSNTAWSTSFCV